jgi:hypothetical protein
MKQFKINFPLDGKETALFVQSMDDTQTRYAIEREENDPHPLLIEHCQDKRWHILSQDPWCLNEDQIHDLGCKITSECEKSEPVFSGINAK